jgi:hypothetical protein
MAACVIFKLKLSTPVDADALPNIAKVRGCEEANRKATLMQKARSERCSGAFAFGAGDVQNPHFTQGIRKVQHLHAEATYLSAATGNAKKKIFTLEWVIQTH